MSFTASPVLALTLPLWRSRLLIGLFGLLFAVMVGRAIFLQGMNTDFLQAKGESRYGRTLEITANRGRITDRHGEVLAVSTPVKSLGMISGEAAMTPQQLVSLSALLQMPVRDIERRLADSTTNFTYLRRQVAPDVAEQVAGLRIPGLQLKNEFRRYYPGGEVMAHVIGFTGADDIGQEGMELAYQAQLLGKAGSRRVIRDRPGAIVEDVEAIKPAEDGQDLMLSIDAKIQNLAFGQLKAAVEAHRAKAGAVVVLDSNTGEVLALANLPTYNPNNRSRLAGAQLRNRVLTDTFEPGSTMKPFTTATALELGRIKPDMVIQTSPGKLTIGTATISDSHPHGALTVEGVLQKSSNIGTAKIALGMEPREMWDMLNKSGFGIMPQVPFPGAVAGKVKPYKSWRPIEQVTMSYGYGLSVSLIQLARAYTIFARDGELMPLSFVRGDGELVRGEQVVSAQTARAVRRMLEMAASEGGTAPKARTMGYRVAGKTGTAHKLENGSYAERKYRASFVGFAPVSNPRLVIAVMIDEPSAGKYFGGDVAAPVFSQIMGGALRLLSVVPDAPNKPIIMPPEGEEVQESI